MAWSRERMAALVPCDTGFTLSGTVSSGPLRRGEGVDGVVVVAVCNRDPLAVAELLDTDVGRAKRGEDSDRATFEVAGPRPDRTVVGVDRRLERRRRDRLAPHLVEEGGGQYDLPERGRGEAGQVDVRTLVQMYFFDGYIYRLGVRTGCDSADERVVAVADEVAGVGKRPVELLAHGRRVADAGGDHDGGFHAERPECLVASDALRDRSDRKHRL